MRSAKVLACAVCCLFAMTAAAESSWPAWDRFKSLYVSEDGRVIDRSTPREITTSEGQAYASLFALAANDRAGFDLLLRWTRDNLSGGDIARKLPAWQWGRGDDGSWRVLDANAASDADLWLAYVLGEAGRLWCDDSLSALSKDLAARILREEAALIPGIGLTVLPGPRGFVSARGWRLNASYLPLFLIRGVQRQTGDRLWRDVLSSSRQVIVGSSPRGFAGDWVLYRQGDGFLPDAESGSVGGYDAIRVYLWAGMMPARDPDKAALIRQLTPMRMHATSRGAIAEKIHVETLAFERDGPYGFSAALLPMLDEAGATVALRTHRARAEGAALKTNDNYYSDVLTLFGVGWLDSYYRFDREARLVLKWKSTCRRAR